MARFRIGSDTGGTFTDVVELDEAVGKVFTTVPSAPGRPEIWHLISGGRGATDGPTAPPEGVHVDARRASTLRGEYIITPWAASASAVVNGTKTAQ
jgi:hypothetical protein